MMWNHCHQHDVFLGGREIKTFRDNKISFYGLPSFHFTVSPPQFNCFF
jgi:hypothetical protein